MFKFNAKWGLASNIRLRKHGQNSETASCLELKLLKVDTGGKN